MLSAKIVGRYEELPDDPFAQDLYGDYKANNNSFDSDIQ